jgi:hypothetical protein
MKTKPLILLMSIVALIFMFIGSAANSWGGGPATKEEIEQQKFMGAWEGSWEAGKCSRPCRLKVFDDGHSIYWFGRSDCHDSAAGVGIEKPYSHEFKSKEGRTYLVVKRDNSLECFIDERTGKMIIKYSSGMFPEAEARLTKK